MDFTNLIKIGKRAGIILSVVMGILGILILFFPTTMLVLGVNIAVIALILFGVVQIIQYFKDTIKNGWLLASGIIMTVMSVMILFDSALVKIETLALLFAFQSLLSAFNQFSLSAVMKNETGKGSGLLIFSAIMSILVGLFLIIYPVMSLAVEAIVFGVYLIFGAISLFTISTKD